MRLDLVLHEKEIAAKTFSVQRPILTEAHVESRLRPRYGVFNVFNLSCGDVSVMYIRRRDGDSFDYDGRCVPWRTED